MVTSFQLREPLSFTQNHTLLTLPSAQAGIACTKLAESMSEVSNECPRSAAALRDAQTFSRSSMDLYIDGD